jgi:hypothetical protein
MMNNRNFWDLGYELWAMSCEIRAIKFMPIVKSLLFSKILCLHDSQSTLNSQFSILNCYFVLKSLILIFLNFSGFPCPRKPI